MWLQDKVTMTVLFTQLMLFVYVFFITEKLEGEPSAHQPVQETTT